MSALADDACPLPEGQNSVDDNKTVPVNNSKDVGKGQASEPTTPKCHTMAFTVDFGETKQFDNRRLEELAKKSQARHQRVQSMSGSVPKSSPVSQRLSMSAKLPRKAQGYNSEGYFSSDQEDSGLSNSLKHRSSPLAQTFEKTNIMSPIITRHNKSPPVDIFQPKHVSKSPIVDSIMSRSDNFTRQSLNLPLKPNSSYIRDVQKSPSFGNLSAYHRLPMADIIDQSPEGIMLTDISSPELDILTPDNGLSTPEYSKSPVYKGRTTSVTPDLFKKCPPKQGPLYIDDDVDRESNNSSTGTYTIEGDNYTEEQKARMSIDRTLGRQVVGCTINKKPIIFDSDPELIFDLSNSCVAAKELCAQNNLAVKTVEAFKASKDKNVLEISCCYESPVENDLATQTSKQIKSTRSYLEKIKNRVKTITEKTFSKSPPRHDDNADMGTFTCVTTSGVLSSKPCQKIPVPRFRRCSLTKSDIDQTDYVHRLSRESSVPVTLPSSKNLLETSKFESTALKNAQKMLQDPDLTPEKVVSKLSYLSLNRCKNDKTWIQDWADSVKNYNNNSFRTEMDINTTFSVEDRPPMSPRLLPTKPRSPHGDTPTKIPSPVGTLLHRRTPDLIPPQDTESYLLKTQNAITNLQAKLHSSRNNISIPSQLTSSLLSEKTLVSRLPISQLSRSNSLNYRLRKKDTSADSSPLRSPGHYVITGSTKYSEASKNLQNTVSRSLETQRRKDSNMNSPVSDRGLLSNSSDDKTLSNRTNEPILLRKTHTRNRSFDNRIQNEIFNDISNANQTVCLKTVLKNSLDTTYRIDQMRNHGDRRTLNKSKPAYNSNNAAFGVSIKRSSSFNTVNKNNNLDPRLLSRRSSGLSEYNSDESDTVSLEKSQELRQKKLHRGRIDSPDLKSVVPVNSPRCPNTPEMQRKFGPGLVRSSVRAANKDRVLNTRMSEPPVGKEERLKPTNHQSRRVAEPTRQAVVNRLSRTRSSTREPQKQEKVSAQKKPNQHRSSSALATKEIEFSNWKKRAKYDPMKAAQEGRKKQQIAKRQEVNKDDLSSPSHSSPVHRSQSFHTTNIADLTLDYSSEGTEDDQPTLPIDPMITSTHSDILDVKKRQGLKNDVVLTRDYVTNFKVNKPEKKRHHKTTDYKETIDKRKTFILDSDTNSTTNGSSPRNSSIFSHEKNSLLGTSDTEGESGTESAPVMRQSRTQVNPKQRYSGEFSMSSSTTSASKKSIQPRYLDISKYKTESSPKNFLRRDPSKTYVGVLPEKPVSKGSAQHYEMEQKKQELEKWKRRASYDPRKAAALGKSVKPVPKTARA
ncbi:uncharacterized protein LOC126972164 isoform X2 [Leptidea sinapis]|uniref:uncharacterized protein LOC126972164 isoform X2 n=1 Tax=Leptidea sinapis TaxID=189913 RepID=UPI00212C59B3|nr:uncharacterized protein LOC126972164 isoform X2 [Leptidea sinapis]